MTRPELSAPRRKSRSLRGRFSRLRFSAKAGAAAVVATGAAPTESSVTSRDLPCRMVLYAVCCFRFRTTRVRSPACTTLTDFRLPWLMSTVERPRPLDTPGKSSAMRAGDWMAKPAGGALSAWDRSMRMTSTPPWMEPVTDSIAVCACEGSATTNAKAAIAACRTNCHVNPLYFFIFYLSCSCNLAVRSIHSPAASCTISRKETSVSLTFTIFP